MKRRKAVWLTTLALALCALSSSASAQLTVDPTTQSMRRGLVSVGASCVDTTGPGTVTCAFGGAYTEAVNLSGGAVAGRLCECWPGLSNGQLYDNEGALVSGFTTGRSRDVGDARFSTEGMYWSAPDNAYWPIDPATGAFWPDNASSLWFSDNTCTGMPMLAFDASNRIQQVEGGATYAQGGSVSMPSSCYFIGGGMCNYGICPAKFAIAVATNGGPPSLAQGAPYTRQN